MHHDYFVDTSGWAEFIDVTLPHHQKASDFAVQCVQRAGKLVTTQLVLIELTALLIKPVRMPKKKQIQLLHQLRRDPSIVVVEVADALIESAWQLWESRVDKDWSMVDCASFVVMQERGLTDALTTDHHFEQAGFVQLLK